MKPEELINATLGNGWRLTNVRQSAARVSGGCHSWCYYAEGIDKKRAFVKVLDPNLNPEHDDPLADLELRIASFRYEREIVRKCSDKKMSRIIFYTPPGVFHLPAIQLHSY